MSLRPRAAAGRVVGLAARALHAGLAAGPAQSVMHVTDAASLRRTTPPHPYQTLGWLYQAMEKGASRDRDRVDQGVQADARRLRGAAVAPVHPLLAPRADEAPAPPPGERR